MPGLQSPILAAVRSHLLREPDLEEHEGEPDEGEIAAPLYLLGRKMQRQRGSGSARTVPYRKRRSVAGAQSRPRRDRGAISGGSIHFERSELRVEVNSLNVASPVVTA